MSLLLVPISVGKKSCTFITPHEAGEEEEEALAEVSKVQEGGRHVIFTTYLRQCTSAHAAAHPHPAKSPTCNFDIILQCLKL